jgi:hypothetical protein
VRCLQYVIMYFVINGPGSIVPALMNMKGPRKFWQLLTFPAERTRSGSVENNNSKI